MKYRHLVPVLLRRPMGVIKFLTVAFVFVISLTIIVRSLPSAGQQNLSENEQEALKVALRAIQIKRDLAESKHSSARVITLTNTQSIFVDGSFLRGEIIQELETLIEKENANIIPGLGDGGVAVQGLVPENETQVLKKKEAFNFILSQKIPYTRKLPDIRHPLCTNLVFDADLPTASVVIVFINEAWSTLMRTIYSVLNRSPPHLLKEIVLVDDLSTRECLGKQLEYYINTRLPNKVRLVRLQKRSGLIQARINGAKAATGDVIVFLDAHCEATPLWLEPMLQRIKDVPNAAVIPMIDIIDDNTFEYKYSKSLSDIQVGGFTWSGHFTWFLPKLANRTLLTNPIPSPTMAGGLFAIGRKYFFDIGAYDPLMEVWGGENLEISFRIWQCGGRMEALPCSRVGHVFRDFHPYTFPGGKDTHGINTARLAEVWMDGYKRFLYLHRADLLTLDIGELTERKELRKRLKCNNFRWYLDHVYPEKFILDEDVMAHGRVMLNVSKPVGATKRFCFDTMQRDHDDGHNYILGIYPCHAQIATSQYFSMTNKGILRRETMCAEVQDIVKSSGYVTMYHCHGGENQNWRLLPDGKIQHLSSSLCIDAGTTADHSHLKATVCKEGSITQSWEWNYVTKLDS